MIARGCGAKLAQRGCRPEIPPARDDPPICLRQKHAILSQRIFGSARQQVQFAHEPLQRKTQGVPDPILGMPPQ